MAAQRGSLPSPHRGEFQNSGVGFSNFEGEHIRLQERNYSRPSFAKSEKTSRQLMCGRGMDWRIFLRVWRRKDR